MATVLCTGEDRSLMATRTMILRKAGHKVIAAYAGDNFEELCRNYDFDVAVIGQTVKKPVKNELLKLIREHCPDAKVLELYTTGKLLPDADAWLRVPADLPADFAETVSALAEGSKGARS